jgi:protease I
MRGRTPQLASRLKREVTSAGGVWVDVPMDKAHVYGNLVTAPAWPAHSAWLAKFLEVLGTKIAP